VISGESQPPKDGYNIKGVEMIYQILAGLWLASLLVNMIMAIKSVIDGDLDVWWKWTIMTCWISVISMLFVRSLLDAIVYVLKG
jgi:hypothetical protein